MNRCISIKKLAVFSWELKTRQTNLAFEIFHACIKFKIKLTRKQRNKILIGIKKSLIFPCCFKRMLMIVSRIEHRINKDYNGVTLLSELLNSIRLCKSLNRVCKTLLNNQ